MFDIYFPTWLPQWAHPRSPLVAIFVRKGSIWDLRIAGYTRMVVRIISNLYAILLIYLPVTVAIIAAGRSFLTLFLFIVLVTLGPVLLITSEVLYLRLWFILPSRTSDMIAGEIERQTWDILLSTPIPRRQIILSKMAAVYWANQPSIIYIWATRFVILFGVFAWRALETNSPISASPLAWIGWMVAIFWMPFAELFALSSLGLLLSTLARTVRNALLLSLVTQLAFRLLTMAILFAFFVNVSNVLILPAALFPQWTFIPFWRGLPYGNSMVWGLVVMGFVWPLLAGLVSLWATLRIVNEAR
jgi:ABC-type transport system involved in multi-copper enzyme maturation permease subunit